MKYFIATISLVLTYLGIFQYTHAQSLDKLHSELEVLLESSRLDTFSESRINPIREQALSVMHQENTNNPKWSKTLSSLIYLFYKRKEYEFLKKNLLPSHLIRQEGAFPPSSFSMGRVYYWLGHTYDNTNSRDSAINFFNKASQLQEKFLDSAKLHISYSVLGLLHKYKMLYKESIKYFERALAIKSKIAPTSMPKDYNKLATVYLQLGDLYKAKIYLEKCINGTDDTKILHHAYTNYGRFYENKALIENDSSYFKKAIIEHEKALEIRKELKRDKDLLNSNLNLGAIHIYLENYKEAIHFYENARKLESESTSPEMKIKIRENLSDIYFYLRQYEQAINTLNFTIDSLREGKMGFNPSIELEYYSERLSKKRSFYREALSKDELLKMKDKTLHLTLFFSALAIALFVIILIEQNNTTRAQHEKQVILDKRALTIAKERIKTQGETLKWVSRILHDPIQNYLIAWQVQLCEDTQKENRAKISELLEVTRKISHKIGPVMIKDGLMPTLHDLISQINDFSSFEIKLNSTHMKKRRFADIVEEHMYGIVNEALNNIIKHANAVNVSIQLIYYEKEQYLSLIVEDDGKGFDTNKDTYGIGLSGMKDRVKELNGQFHIDSKVGNGTTIIVEVPAEVKKIV